MAWRITSSASTSTSPIAIPTVRSRSTQFKIYSSTSGAIESTTTLFTQNLVYDMDGGDDGDVSLQLSEVSTGSGTDDYAVLVPVTKFAGLDPATTYMYLYVDMGSLGGDYVAAGGFEEWNLQSAGSLTGIKFADTNGNGIQDAGEVGSARRHHLHR